MSEFELTLTKSYLLNPRTRHLEFKINNLDFQFKAGQFITLNINHNNTIIRRNFSIASSPEYLANNDKHIEIAATFVPNGIASTMLWQITPGNNINASGPYGIFVLKPENIAINKRYILVATGTGVTPYRSMLPDLQILLNQNPELNIVLLLGVRDNTELLYGEDFLNFSNLNNNRFKFNACYSRQTKNLNSDFETNGYVQDQLSKLDINPNQDLVYLCGNPNMIDQSVTILESLNMPKNKIRREKYISSR